MTVFQGLGDRAEPEGTVIAGSSSLFIWKSEPYMLDACLGKNSRPSIFENFSPLEATTPLKRGFKNPRPSISRISTRRRQRRRLRGALQIQDLHLLRIQALHILRISTHRRQRRPLIEALKMQDLQFSRMSTRRRQRRSAWARPRPSAHVILAWVYKTCLGLISPARV